MQILSIGRLLFVLVAFASNLLLSGLSLAQEAKNTNQPLSGYELDIGLNHSPPFVYINGAFTDLKGIDVDIIRELQRRTGFKLKRDRFHMMGFENLISLATKGQMDLAAGAISITDNRAKIFTQSPGIFHSTQVVITPTNSNIRSINDLVGKKVAAEVGTNSADILPANIAKQIDIHHEVTTFMLFYAVLSGHADALVTEEPMAHAIIKSWADDKLKIAFKLEGSQSNFGYMMKKDSKVSHVLYVTLEQMKADGTVDKIIAKYLPEYNHYQNINAHGHSIAQQSHVIADQ